MIEVAHLSKSFDGGKTQVLKNVSFKLKQGNIYSIVGESGSGKTTLIRLICGLETPEKGSITIANEVVNSDTKFVKPEERNVGLVFQDYALFPHMTVEANIAYGLRRKENKTNRIQEVLGLVGLEGYGNRYPHELSGGQQQRVALARALAPNPKVLILDEPFSNLDAALRNNLRNEIFAIVKSTGVTAIFVTHDTADALAVSDELLILQDGELVQMSSPEILYTQPKTSYVARLFGEILMLNNNLKKAFGMHNYLNVNCAVRVDHIRFESTCEFSTQVKVNAKHFLGNRYGIQVGVENESVQLFSEIKINADHLTIGFNAKDVLQFT